MERDVAILTVKSNNKKFRFIGKPFRQDEVDETDMVIDIKVFTMKTDGEEFDPENKAIKKLLDMVEENEYESS